MKNLENSLDYINSKLSKLSESSEIEKLLPPSFKPEIGLILGSGLGELADEIKGISIPYSEIPGFKSSGVLGHAGKLVIGELCSRPVIAMQGRLHYYEGNTIQEIVYPVKVMKLLGVEKLIVTNAAGGINKGFSSGDLMIIADHINLLGNNPLIGKNNDELGQRFPDMSNAYDKSLICLAEAVAKNLNINTQKGVYAAMTGPTYETPSEVRMLRVLGADAVGMSTVPEVIVANHMGIKVLGISCITNMACGILNRPLNHAEVIETAEKVKKDFQSFIKAVISSI